MNSKICRICKVEKPIENFRIRSGMTIRRHDCKKCEWKYQRRQPWNKIAWNLRRKCGGDITPTQIRALDSARCYICGGAITANCKKEIDHVSPKSKGGAATAVNLRWAHRVCNRMKHDMTLEEFKERLRLIANHLGVIPKAPTPKKRERRGK